MPKKKKKKVKKKSSKKTKKKIKTKKKSSRIKSTKKRKVRKKIKKQKESGDQELIIKTRSEWIKESLINKSQYTKKYNDSIKNNNEFWAREGKRINWIKPYSKIKDVKKLKDLKSNAIIGTSSFRREFQIKKIRKDFNTKLIRGNVDTRIQKLKDGLYDAIVLSYAGIKFLKLEENISQILSIEEMMPSAGQGIIALQCRNHDEKIKSLLQKINDKDTKIRAMTERNVLKVLEGDCETAVGVHSEIINNKIILKTELFSLDGAKIFFEKGSASINEAEQLGLEIGKKLKLKSGNSYKK